jgi:hypothetical protein
MLLPIRDFNLSWRGLVRVSSACLHTLMHVAVWPIAGVPDAQLNICFEEVKGTSSNRRLPISVFDLDCFVVCTEDAIRIDEVRECLCEIAQSRQQPLSNMKRDQCDDFMKPRSVVGVF